MVRNLEISNHQTTSLTSYRCEPKAVSQKGLRQIYVCSNTDLHARCSIYLHVFYYCFCVSTWSLSNHSISIVSHMGEYPLYIHSVTQNAWANIHCISIVPHRHDINISKTLQNIAKLPRPKRPKTSKIIHWQNEAHHQYQPLLCFLHGNLWPVMKENAIKRSMKDSERIKEYSLKEYWIWLIMRFQQFISGTLCKCCESN